MKFILSLLMLLATSQSANAALRVMACEPEWGALVTELGGELVNVYTATGGLQDPHHVEARPSFIAQARRAELLVCTGAELEAGWLPVLLRQAGNARIQPGSPGYFEAAAFVPKLDVPARLDRSEGDVHAAGNPHIQTDPHNIARVAEALSKRLAEVDPANAAAYQSRYAAFSVRWRQAIQRWEKQAAPLKGVAIVVHHKGWSYLTRWLGMREVAALEPKPGIEPSVAYLTGVLARLQKDPARIIIRNPYNDSRASEWLAERTRMPMVVLPFTVGGNENARDLFSLFDDTLQRLLGAGK